MKPRYSIPMSINSFKALLPIPKSPQRRDANPTHPSRKHDVPIPPAISLNLDHDTTGVRRRTRRAEARK